MKRNLTLMVDNKAHLYWIGLEAKYYRDYESLPVGIGGRALIELTYEKIRVTKETRHRYYLGDNVAGRKQVDKNRLGIPQVDRSDFNFYRCYAFIKDEDVAQIGSKLKEAAKTYFRSVLFGLADLHESIDKAELKPYESKTKWETMRDFYYWLGHLA